MPSRRPGSRSSSPRAASSEATRSVSPRRRCKARSASTSRIPGCCWTTCSLPMAASCPRTAYRTLVEAELAFIMTSGGRPRLHAVRRAQCHRLRGAGAGNPRHQDRTGRPADQIDPQDLRYHCRQRGQCRHVLGGLRRARSTPTCAGSARCATATASWKRPGLPPACHHPATSVAWLNKIAPLGLALEAGHTVCRILHPADRDRKGDTIPADYGPYGSVSCYFA